MWTCRRAAPAGVAILMCAAALALAPRDGSAQTLPPGWASQDIGGAALAGSDEYAFGTFTIAASGVDIGGTSDQFRFVYQRVAGDVDVIARVDRILQTDIRAKAGVMIRSSLAADAVNGATLVSAASGVVFERRKVTGGASAVTGGPAASAPYWVRILRQGTKVYSYASSDGRAWTRLATASVSLGTTVYVGLAVTSANASALTTAIVSNVAVIPMSVQAPQTSIDIGAPSLASIVTEVSGTYDVRASGVDIGGTSDQFNYIYQPISGDFDVSVRVVSLTKASRGAKTGVMVRETLGGSARHASALMSSTFLFQRRLDPLGSSFSTSAGASTFPGWVKLVRRGTVFEAFYSSDGLTWVSIGSETILMSNDVEVGIATTSHDQTTRAEAVLDNFSIVPHAPTGNQAPIVALTSPGDGATVPAGTDVTVTATASDPDGTITKVDFFVGTELIGSDADAPYAATWALPAAGTYSLRAVAYDDAGASTASTPSTVTVDAIAPPTGVAFHKSVDHDTLVNSYELRIFPSGSTTFIARSDLGKPVPDANGDITVDQSSLFLSLVPGSYLATIAAIGAGGSSQSDPIAFSR